jgi:hypothetical protein
MAFNLLGTNGSGLAVIDAPAGVLATQDSFIDLYTYAEKFQPELIPQLHMANGKGKITHMLKLMCQESTYASDMIQHAEEGRLHTIIKDVTVAVNTFTSTTPHNLVVKDIVKISDGISREAQATVTSVTSPLVFVATNDAGVAFSFGGNVDVICDFSNSYEKGSDDPETGKRWEPNVYENFTHILKLPYNISASDMIHKSWIETPEGPKWFNHEIERSGTLFDNKVELTQMFFERKASGSDRGTKGVLSQIESRGNIGNEYLTSIEDLSDIAFRAKQQGGCREFTIWHNHQQGALLRQMIAGVNAHYAGGANYGMFQNQKDMAMMLGFNSVYIDGVTFHFTPWSLLDDPSLLGNTKFRATNLACLIIPSGNTYASENGNTVSKPYLSVRYRGDETYNRKREIKLFGPGGTPHKKDIQTTQFTSEFTNQLIGGNEFFAVRTGVFYS